MASVRNKERIRMTGLIEGYGGGLLVVEVVKVAE
jgi:hypothetical protein